MADEVVVGADGLVEVRWAYTPKDRAKQGTTERLAPEMAAIKVREGSAVYTGNSGDAEVTRDVEDVEADVADVAVTTPDRPVKHAATRQAPPAD